MFNCEVPHKTSADVLNGNGQIASYFVAVDNAVTIGDTNKRYQPVNNASYAPPAPIRPHTFTTVIISPTADNTADIYNGFIYANMNVKVHLNKDITKWAADTISVKSTNSEGEPTDADATIPREFGDVHSVWVGFKDSMDAIEKYEILANGISIYTQNNAIEESFITACSMTDGVKKGNRFSHVRHKDVFEDKAASGCGRYIDFGSINNANYKSGTGVDINIPLKIDLRRFLPLSNVKYLPAFAGKIELRICFGVQGLVCAPVNPLSKAVFANTPFKFAIDSVTNEFVPVGEQFAMITTYKKPTFAQQSEDPGSSHALIPTALGKLTAKSDCVITATMNEISQCESVINCFGIASDVYDELVMHYSNTPLTFPTQTLSFTPFSNTLKDKANAVSSITITPRFIDSFFLLFPLKQTYRTCYKNPGIVGYQLQCGGYGSIPGIMHGTAKDDASRTLEELQNALNVNGDIVGLNKDVVNSITHEVTTFNTGLKSDNTTDFLVGFATETDNTFQQGQTSNTPITYSLVIAQDQNSNYSKNVELSPILGVLTDSTFSIQVQPSGAPPIVEIGAYDITSPVTVM